MSYINFTPDQPAVREAMSSGELGYTKAREIVGVATPDTQDSWLEAAKGSRRELVEKIKAVKRAARVDPRQPELIPAPHTVVAPKEIPVRFQMDLTPEQEARRAALVERLHKLGGAPNNRAELMLEALAALVESKEKTPRGALARDRHRCRAPGCGRTRFLEVHHVVPRGQGGINQAENLVTLCGSCHRHVHDHGRGTATNALIKIPSQKES